MQRREFLATVAAAGVAAAEPATLWAGQGSQKVQRKGRVRQALFRNVFGQTDIITVGGQRKGVSYRRAPTTPSPSSTGSRASRRPSA